MTDKQIQALKDSHAELFNAMSQLQYHVRKSVNVGPLSNRPDMEAKLWVKIHGALERARALRSKFDG